MDPFAPREPTHEPLDFGVVMKLTEALLGQASKGPISAETIAALAESEGVDRSFVWAAAGGHPFIQMERKHDVAVAVCVGRCQMWGATELLESTLELSKQRAADGKAGFDLIPRNCLNRCHDAPMAFVVLPEGAAGLPRATRDDIAGVLAEIDSLVE